jgi:hypothetical protein
VVLARQPEDVGPVGGEGANGAKDEPEQQPAREGRGGDEDAWESSGLREAIKESRAGQFEQNHGLHCKMTKSDSRLLIRRDDQSPEV